MWNIFLFAKFYSPVQLSINCRPDTIKIVQKRNTSFVKYSFCSKIILITLLQFKIYKACIIIFIAYLFILHNEIVCFILIQVNDDFTFGSK